MSAFVAIETWRHYDTVCRSIRKKCDMLQLVAAGCSRLDMLRRGRNELLLRSRAGQKQHESKVRNPAKVVTEKCAICTNIDTKVWLYLYSNSA